MPSRHTCWPCKTRAAGEPYREPHTQCHAGRQVLGEVGEDLEVQQPVPLAGGAVPSFPLRGHPYPGRDGRLRPHRNPWRPCAAHVPSAARPSPGIDATGAKSRSSHPLTHASWRTGGHWQAACALRFAPVRSGSLRRFSLCHALTCTGLVRTLEHTGEPGGRPLCAPAFTGRAGKRNAAGPGWRLRGVGVLPCRHISTRRG
jgi:hypothetical protein